jgi:hypothetical protein
MSSPRKTRRRTRTFTLVLAAIVAALALAACGSSSTSSSSTASKSASASSTSAPTANRTTLVACLKKHGITPPAHVPGGTSTNHTGTPPAGGTGAGANSSARQAAFKACGATGHFGGGSSTTTTGG